MIVLGNLLKAIGAVGSMMINIYIFILVISAFLSWFAVSHYNPIVDAIFRITFPPLRWLRRRLPLVYGGIDFSPVVLIVILYFFKILIFDTIYIYGEILVRRSVPF